MRDPQRIEQVLVALRAAWERNPELRLGQLISDAAGRTDVFYVEDDDLLDALKRLDMHE